ncbi:MAG: indolepyruvate/phenylpyruvate decarboxylase [Rhodobacterales bacterium]|nr:indolepyruvate/phenylpyruvate decarboxylase [Rhodobacterales bacterium]
MPTLARALLTALKDHGAREIFGIPGDFALPFFKHIEDSNLLPLHTLSHEPGVGFAADAAARLRSGLGVAAVTYGAGALNMVNAVAQAYAEKSPLVVISGAPGASEGARGLGLHHQVKHLDTQAVIYRELTCDQAILRDAATAPAEIARVLRNARDRSLPVYIELPRDMVGAPCDDVPVLPPLPWDDAAARAAAAAVMARLKTAARPVILCGVEIRRFGLEDKVARLARTLGLPTATSFMGRGLLAGAEAPLMGTYLGQAGDEAVCHAVEDSDALLMLGVILADTNFGVSARNVDMRNAVHAFDREVRLSHHVYPNIPLPALVDALLDIAEPLGTATAAADAFPRGLVADDAPVTPTDIAMAVNDLFDRVGRLPIASDMGDCLFTAMDIEHTELVAPGYYASMGPGVPAGLGLQAASGRRPLVLVGDGAFQMTGWELGNCRRHGWAPIVILFNNRSWEMLRTFQPGPAYHDLDDWRFADMAPGMGGAGHRVATRVALKAALDAAWDDPSRFHLIEVMLDRGAISRTLERFVGAIRKMSVLGA